MLGAVSSSPRFTFVRHGQCVANAQGRVVGQLDSPLTTLGFTQAEGAAVLLAGRRPRRPAADPDPGSWTRGIQQLLEEAR